MVKGDCVWVDHTCFAIGNGSSALDHHHCVGQEIIIGAAPLAFDKETPKEHGFSFITTVVISTAPLWMMGPRPQYVFMTLELQNLSVCSAMNNSHILVIMYPQSLHCSGT
jgi:hypothetical protein